MFVTMTTISITAKLLMAARIAITTGSVFIAAQRVVDGVKRIKDRCI